MIHFNIIRRLNATEYVVYNRFARDDCLSRQTYNRPISDEQIILNVNRLDSDELLDVHEILLTDWLNDADFHIMDRDALELATDSAFENSIRDELELTCQSKVCWKQEGF